MNGVFKTLMVIFAGVTIAACSSQGGMTGNACRSRFVPA